MTAEMIRDLRAALEETTTAFGARFSVSRRTVEDWEQGRHTPHKLVLRLLDTLHTEVTRARRTK